MVPGYETQRFAELRSDRRLLGLLWYTPAAYFERNCLSHPQRLFRWLAIGAVFTVLNLPVLYLLVEFGRLSPALATLVAGEISVLARFLVNDAWVFRERDRRLRRLGQFHIATAGSFAVWWSAANGLTALGVHYLLAAVAATSVSVGCNLATNFLWVWRKERSPLGDTFSFTPSVD